MRLYSIIRIFTIALAAALSFTPAAFAHNGSGPEIDKDGNVIFHAEPDHKIAPIMPPRARESGYCCVILDITKRGRVKNPKVLYCSNPVFWDVTKRTVPRLTYLPKMVNGEAVDSKGYLEHFSYRLADQHGNLITNADGYPKFDEEGDHVKEHYCLQYIA